MQLISPIKFRYQIKSNWRSQSLISLMYETVFLDSKGKWRSVHKEYRTGKSFYPLADQINERQKLAYYNYYEYEVDIKAFRDNPIKSKVLLYYLFFEEANTKHRSLINKICGDKRIENNIRKEYNTRSYHGGVDAHSFKAELKKLFPEVCRSLPEKMFNPIDTFRFILKTLDVNNL